MKPFVCIAIAFTISFLYSCDKDPAIENEEELITQVELTLTPESGGAPVVFRFQDDDGDGGNAPVISASSSLSKGVGYTFAVRFRNTSISPAEDITEEVRDEAAEHQVFYVVSGNLKDKLTLTYNDKDKNNLPVGLTGTVQALQPGEGTLTVILKHLPDKTAAGVKEGNPANAGGETDVEVVFPVTIL